MPKIELTLLRPGNSPVTLQLDRDVITMGRSSDCVVPIENRFLSRHHADLVSERGGWVLRDKGSVNGTFLNGERVRIPVAVNRGDHIRMGDTEVVIGAVAPGTDVAEGVMPVTQFFLRETEVKESAERSRVIQHLALELIADRPMAELFDFILDRVEGLMRPSRAALALLGEGGVAKIVNMRPKERDPKELAISRTLIGEVVRDRKVVVFRADAGDALLAEAKSIVAQRIYSALCAPLVAGNSVLGVLYVDYQLSGRPITEEDAQLAAQIARVAAIKLESTRLREAALEKSKLDEALKVAQAIQMRMLPQLVPPLTPESRFDIAAAIRPARQVGGDFYDFHATSDGKLYFCIGDVSGKGIPAALTMAVSRALFRSFILAGRDPGALMAAVNRQLCDETDDTVFVTAFCGVLDLRTGEVRCANAGHNPPLIVKADGTIHPLEMRPAIVLGYVPTFEYAEESIALAPGDLLFLHTDGITEATNATEEMFSDERVESVLIEHARSDAKVVETAMLDAVATFVGEAPQSDDLTMLCIRYLGKRSAEGA